MVQFPIDALTVYGEIWAALLFLVVVAKALGNESRVYAVALVAVILAPVHWSVYFVVLLMLSFRLVDLVKGVVS